MEYFRPSLGASIIGRIASANIPCGPALTRPSAGRIKPTVSVARMAVFLGVVLALAGAIHYYLWVRLVRDPSWPSPWLAVGTWALVALAVSIPGGFVADRLLPRDWASPFAWVAFVWMGAMFLLVVMLLPAELIRLAHGWLTASGAQAAEAGAHAVGDPGRRRFLARSIASVVGASTLGLGAASMVTALRPVAVKPLSVTLPGLPEALRGLRIVQLTDIHVGPTIGGAFLEQIVQTTNELEPDVVAITGDLVDGSVAELGQLIEPLRGLRARHGVFFVTGNHEYYSGVDDWVEHLGALGVRVLRNERVTLEHDGAQIDLAGVDDWEARGFSNGHGPDLERALEGKPADRKVILLAHQPKQIDEAAQSGVDLQLSGHTHGGQIFPFNYLVRLQQPYIQGLHRHGRSQLYVSPGTGYWGPPMRLGVPAEVTMIELA